MRELRNCTVCNKEFWHRNSPSDRKINNGKFCSQKCCVDSRRTVPETSARRICNVEFKNTYGRVQKLCSRECLVKNLVKTKTWNKGIKMPLWVREKFSKARMGKEPWNKGKPWIEMRKEKTSILESK